MSSTTSAASSSTTTLSSSDENSRAFFSSGGSTLILAFLAIGLFVGGLLVMFSMRRYVNVNRRRMRAWQPNGERSWGWDPVLGLPASLLVDMNSPSRRHKDFGKRPALWDVQIAAAKRTWTGKWEEATPIAARHLDAGRHSPPACGLSLSGANASARSRSPTPPLDSSILYPFRVGLRDTRAQLASLRVPWSRQAPNNVGASSQRLVDGTPRSSGTAEPRAPRAEIAFVIALPTQTPSASGRVPLFALGVTNVRWGGGSLAPEDATSPIPPRYPHVDADDTSRRS